MKNFLIWVAIGLSAILISACGGSGGGATPSAVPGPTGSANNGLDTVSLTSITVTPIDLTIPKGLTRQFTATGNYSDGTSQEITAAVAWSSSDAKVAGISNSGMVTSVARGESTITATQGSISASVKLVVNDATLTAIALTPDKLVIPKGLTNQFTATGTYSDGVSYDITADVTWASTVTGIAMIDKSGLASALTVGSSTITATIGEISGSADLRVSSAFLITLSIDPDSPSMAKGLTKQLVATGFYSDGTSQDITTAVTWYTGSPAVAIPAWNGMVYSYGVGSTAITATLGYASVYTMVTVTPATLQTIQITPANATLAKGLTTQFSALGIYSDGTAQDITAEVTWSSSVSTIATISNAGLASAAAVGATTITATLGDQSGTTPLNVSPAALQSISLTPGNPTLPKGLTTQFTAIGSYSDGSSHDITTTVTWSSNSTTVATVNNTGLAVAGTVGPASITARLGVVSATTSLTVTPAALQSISLTPGNPTIPDILTTQLAAIGSYSDGKSYDITATVTWNSNTPSVATVSNTGLVSPVAAGSARITATMGTIAGNTNVTVSSATLKTITVTPSDPTISSGLSKQFTATATYTDGNNYDITSLVTWSSNNTAVATIDGNGMASVITVGTAVITATRGALSGNTTLTISQISNVGLTPLSAWAGVSDWETFQGNAAHTGYIPVTLDPSVFASRWIWNASSGSSFTTISVANGQFYLASGSKLYALSEYDASALWNYDFSGLTYPSVNPPAVSGGKVYIAAGQQSSTYMYGFDASTGSVLFKTQMSSQWEHYLAPTVSNGVVFQNAGTYGGLYSIDGTTGNTNFFTSLAQFDGWTPAVDATHAYAYVYGTLQVVDRANGSIVSSITDPSYQWRGWTAVGAPVLGASNSVFAINESGYGGDSNALVDFNTGASSIAWSNAGMYVANPAYHGGVLYALNKSPYRLEARSETDGTLLWSWVPQLSTENTFTSDVLLTSNMVFVSTNIATYAIDLNTHQVVWSYPQPGRLALSKNGVLYIAQTQITSGNIYAINVK